MNDAGLRVAHLTATFPPYPGGAGNTAFRFAREQAERGHRVEVFTAPAPGEIPDPGGAVVHRIDPLLAIGNAPLIPSLARIEGFDVVHLHYPFIFGSELTLLGRLRRRRRAQALLVHYKNRLVGKGARGAMFEAYEHTVAPALIRAADRVCVLSADHAASVSYLRRAGERHPAKLIEMPNGVDAELFSPGPDRSGLRGRLGIAADAVVAAFVATLDLAHHFKRLDLAIDGLARLGNDSVHIVVAGGGELLEGFRARATEAGVGERVHFLGPIAHAELPEVLRAADLFLLTTEPPESFGIVLIEAMACGLPAIATEYPGVRAVVDDGSNGILVPPGDPEAVAEALRALVDAGAERAAMGAAGRQKAIREWAWPRLVERLDHAYGQALATRAGDAMSRRILLVSYFYPPGRDTGVLRPAAMAKWLRRLGHEVVVLTTSAYGAGDRDQDVVRTADAQRWRARLRGKDSVGALFDSDTYAGTPHPLSKVLVPEALVGAWLPFARSRALALQRRQGFDCVITSSPPESAHAVGIALKRRGVPWVADIRDAWTFESLRPDYPTAAQRRLDSWLERRWLSAADQVVCVSAPAAEDLRHRQIAEPLLIPNGWDPESEPDARAASVPTGLLDPERVSLVYTGRFGSYGRDPRPLVEAIGRLAREHPAEAAKLELVIAGPLTEVEAELLDGDVSPARIVASGSQTRERALALQREADALLLIAQPARSQLLNIKLFEYLAAGRPIVALAAGTDAGRIVGEVGGEAVRADDPEAIAGALRRLIAGELDRPSPDAIAAYTYPRPAQQMAEAVELAIRDRA